MKSDSELVEIVRTALKEGFYYKDFLTSEIKFSLDGELKVSDENEFVIDFHFYSFSAFGSCCSRVRVKDYGNSWALTRKELGYVIL